MGPGFGVYSTLHLFLDPVIAHRGRGIETFSNVVLRELENQRTRAAGGIGRPGASETIGLQLKANGGRLRTSFVALALHFGRLPGEVLNVVSVLVGNHVGLGERAALGAEL